MRQNINQQVGQIRVSKWAMPEYRTHVNRNRVKSVQTGGCPGIRTPTPRMGNTVLQTGAATHIRLAPEIGRRPEIRTLQWRVWSPLLSRSSLPPVAHQNLVLEERLELSRP